MKLASIDNLRVDGKFLDEEDHVPEGQGVVMSLLNECYDILYELMTTECDD
ncbi:Cu(2+) suppressing and bleomycin sensitive protein 1 [Spiromyces aspiralis]|uniref:Cu(2+) suppressing and bleomycin sensitive protein 1 n=1 Tax=Spiromyces aspiralis TaxID=68401 RepID=A0ACC1HGT7_9FUNG|nr:Cu(2+) suppressing and bleomycin sensitive protein 1 [Spiromyces aspiralis]